ncbi:MAG: Ig-like domain-containing protein [Alistipes sp.]|nr:Ig-like domain-containing protein [Alistipes sp.]
MRRIIKTLLCSLSLLLASCGGGEENIELYSLRIEPKTAAIAVGGTLQLNAISDPVYEGLVYTWASADTTVATVDDNGLVRGVGAGTVEITCKYKNERIARATVQVMDGMVDPGGGTTSKTLDAPMNIGMIFSSRQLVYTGTVMQSFDFHDSSEDGYIYFTQCVSDGTKPYNKWFVALSRVKRGAYGDKTVSSETMSLRWFGHGTVLCVEKATDGKGDYMWTNSNGTLSGTEYTNNKTFSRFRFEPNVTHDHYAGETFYLNSYKDAQGKTYTVYDHQVNIDFTNRRLLIGCRSSGLRHNIVYDLDKVLALKEKDITITRTWGGESGTGTTQRTVEETISARDLGELTPLGSFRLESALNTGDFSKPYSCNHQGHAIWGNYVYWYEGNARELTSGSGVYDGSHAYVEVFDYNGNRVTTRTKVAAVSDFAGMKTLLNLHNNCYCEAEGLQIKDGNRLYLGIATHIAGKSSGNRLATILEYELE